MNRRPREWPAGDGGGDRVGGKASKGRSRQGGPARGQEPGEPHGRKRAARCPQGSDGASRRGGGKPRGRNAERRWQAVPEGGHDVVSGSGHPVRADDGRAALTWREGRSGRDPSATARFHGLDPGRPVKRRRPGRSEGRGRCRGVADVSFHDERPAGPTVLEGRESSPRKRRRPKATEGSRRSQTPRRWDRPARVRGQPRAVGAHP